jgi:hypothetical protein
MGAKGMKRSLLVIVDTDGGGAFIGSFHEGEHNPDLAMAGFRQRAQQLPTDHLCFIRWQLKFLHLPELDNHLLAGLMSLLVVDDFLEGHNL